jgi:hypothetical protein
MAVVRSVFRVSFFSAIPAALPYTLRVASSVKVDWYFWLSQSCAWLRASGIAGTFSGAKI